MASRPLEFIEKLAVQKPALAEDLGELGSLYQRKLWHQLTLKLEELYAKPDFSKGDLPVALYNGFVADFGSKLNLLRLAHLAVAASKSLKDPAAAAAFLSAAVDKLAEWKLPRSEEPELYLRMHVAEKQLEMGAVAECKAAIEDGAAALERLPDPDPSVSAVVHYVSSLYYQLKKDYAKFYRSSMQYLAFVSSDALPPEFKAPLAVDIALAALLGEGVYGFAQLLMHPIVKVLQSGSYAWLGEMLEVFNRGDLPAYDALCAKHAATLNAQPALVENERRLREKVTISCLINLISDLPPEQRNIPLSDIADRTKLNIDGVEFLLMKALSLHLIEGSIDQVDGTAAITWVQSRVLTQPQVAGLKERLDAWVSKVNAVGSTLEQESIGVAEV
ncbi:26S proteasome non-ATPase regulatory subunit 13 [Raphidocelis subcapitata]|uniref:26S proteasome non-ATPase regulatory subunit 13 n=1 Tax=Raphidocelis subcapitata TaxID=307507 RepID=A0A2V0P1X6_9CHLO|nr:26S proteasome non-ATPase regulatory subunit 13 [Raphidocelis subcapitata]|eukprot:GBF93579.1 26S proteasome non-ATPase regulatory subunit 13 [Raphidocelis subcapitata]